VFALAHLLGIKLPRIRNWKDLTFFRPSKDVVYKHLEPLCFAMSWTGNDRNSLARPAASRALIKAGKVLHVLCCAS